VKHLEIRARLSEYLERDLPAEERSRIGAHLDGCVDCEKELSELRATVSLLRGLPDPVLPPGIGAAVMSRIAQGEGREARVHSIFRRIAEPRYAAPLAAGIAGLFFLVQQGGTGPAHTADGKFDVVTSAAARAQEQSSAFLAERNAFENAWRESADGDAGSQAGVVSGFTPATAVRQYMGEVELEQARRRSQAQDVLRQLRGAGHPYSASLAAHSDTRPTVVLAGWQPN